MSCVAFGVTHGCVSCDIGLIVCVFDVWVILGVINFWFSEGMLILHVVLVCKKVGHAFAEILLEFSFLFFVCASI